MQEFNVIVSGLHYIIIVEEFTIQLFEQLNYDRSGFVLLLWRNLHTIIRTI